MLLENGIQNLLDSSNVSAQVQELVLKEPLRKVTNISAITGGHSIASYAKNLTKLAMTKGVRLDVQQDSFFLPTVEGRASIVWTEMNDQSWRCLLAVRGKFLQSIQMASEETDFSGLPFKSTSKCMNVSDPFICH